METICKRQSRPGRAPFAARHLVGLVRRMAEQEGRPFQDIYTGAGHDACNLARRVPTAMIFVPCEGGISQNKIESAKPEDLEAGCNVLCDAMLVRAVDASADGP